MSRAGRADGEKAAYHRQREESVHLVSWPGVGSEWKRRVGAEATAHDTKSIGSRPRDLANGMDLNFVPSHCLKVRQLD